ncbi:MAG: large conductance mechanosensitive channel protein MscL [Planctomycetota bacterium]
MGLLQEFKDFAMKGSVVDLAVGVVIGGAFGKIVSSFVANVIMPPVNLLTSKFDINFSQAALKVQTESPVLDEAGKVVKDDAGEIVMAMQNYPYLNYGPFIETVVEFLLVAGALFLAVKAINQARNVMANEPEVEKPAKPSEDIQLLREIRDSLQK